MTFIWVTFRSVQVNVSNQHPYYRFIKKHVKKTAPIAETVIRKKNRISGVA